MYTQHIITTCRGLKGCFTSTLDSPFPCFFTPPDDFWGVWHCSLRHELHHHLHCIKKKLKTVKGLTFLQWIVLRNKAPGDSKTTCKSKGAFCYKGILKAQVICMEKQTSPSSTCTLHIHWSRIKCYTFGVLNSCLLLPFINLEHP